MNIKNPSICKILPMIFNCKGKIVSYKKEKIGLIDNNLDTTIFDIYLN